MTSLKETLDNLNSSTMNNISELKEISIADMDIKEEKRTGNDGDYTVQFIEVDGKQYRVPYTVLTALKAILEKKPDLQTFSVSRTGTTKDDTRYTVIPQ